MKKSVSFLFGVFLLSGCASVATSNLMQVRQSFAHDDFIKSADKFANSADIQSQDSLELLISGLSQFQAKDYIQSDNTFEEFNKRNYDTDGGSIIRETKSLIGGQLVNEYKPYMMDSLFVSYYQIWDALGRNKPDDVRVIINQSYARQQDMSRAYADMVEKTNEKMSNESASELMTELQKRNAQWAAYTDIMNPALMYLSGIWFLNNGDFNDAETYLKRATGMVPNNSWIKTDLNLAENNQKPTNTTWVFIESGFAPILREESISLPVPLGNSIGWVSIAIAEPEFNNNHLSIYGAQSLADVNAMFMTEFNQYRTNDALRAFVSASARAVAQATAYNSGSKYSGLLGLGATLFSLSTTNAEVRSWVTLPESISVMRLNTANLIDSNLSATLGTDVKLPKSGNYLIYVRLTESTPIVHMFKI